MSTVRIVHPEAGEAEVPESAVPHWRSRGWEQAPERAKQPPADQDAEKDHKPSKTRRRSNEESE